MKQCIEKDCTKTALNQNGVHRCKKHQKEYRRMKYERERDGGRVEQRRRQNSTSIEEQLNCKTAFGGLYKGCSKEKIIAMQTGNVEMLRRIG